MKYAIVLVLFILWAGAARLEAHAFLQQAEPGAGSTLQTPPNEIRIRFTEKIELASSNIQVFAASGKEVDKRDAYLDRSDPALLRVSLPPLEAGTYKVIWRAASIDRHATNGSFSFHVR